MQYVSSLRGMALASSPSFPFDVLCSRLVSTFRFRFHCSLWVLYSHATLWTILSFLGSSSYQQLQLSVLSPFALMTRRCAALGPCAAPSLAFHAVPFLSQPWSVHIRYCINSRPVAPLYFS
jgi:hypothetical protein